jgi:ATP-dependent DNA ligase
MYSGIIGGKMVKHERKYDKGKGSRSPHQQALSELWSMARKKAKQGFTLQLDALSPHPANSDTSRANGSNCVDSNPADTGMMVPQDHIAADDYVVDDANEVPRPMLSMKYAESRLSKCEQAFCQPKLDGVRCIADLRTGRLWSRAGTEILLEHVSSAVKAYGEIIPTTPSLTQNKNKTVKAKSEVKEAECEDEGSQGVQEPLRWLDGELYCHGWSFQKVTSVVRRTKNMAEDDVAKNVALHVFDVVMEAPFRDRWACFRELVERMNGTAGSEARPHAVVAVDTVAAPVGEANVSAMAKAHVSSGYEGSMWRPDNDTPYQADKRSSSSLKVCSGQLPFLPSFLTRLCRVK